MKILSDILAQKKLEVSGLASTLKNAKPIKSRRDFRAAITKYDHRPRLIAEVKKASPSRGEIFPGADVLEIAELYETNGASAISVLTDTEFFQGSLADLHSISRQSEIPILRKDFIIDPLQILEARLSEADAILLMVTVLKTPERIRELREYAESLGMDCLVETHDEAEIEIALAAGATIIGVNARDFKDLSIDRRNFARLLPLIPDDCTKVAESGLTDFKHLQQVADLCDAVLIGTHFVETRDYNEMAQLTRQFAQI